ncbi:MotA/TolQ/ExbB proton channel family protein [Vibrio agarivorans]|uniref:MotA/TolQ/ExbB proton channel family protein n=1 Tax=Vibrio agarivorans TaxID=153622 RepID=A0ABT7Y5N5_9VIBR|nr:MotA/TolQ/ExbB proton channel family protein [Vibrio agarivorans]MDN2483318.1 MotA/TolQ/ExbB proton channel family protein [Vibrio agarivorans]
MKWTPVVSMLALSLTAFTASANTELVGTAKTHAIEQAQHDRSRESVFKLTEKELTELRAKLNAEKSSIEKENDQLIQTFSENEEKLARLEEQLRLETGSLGEVFGVVRQTAKELEAELENSVTGVDAQTEKNVVAEITAATRLPSMAQLNGLWKALEEQIQASGQVTQSTVRFIDGDGQVVEKPVARIGAMGLVDESGYVKWDGARSETRSYVKQPSQVPTLAAAQQLSSGESVAMIVDPSRGVLLEQLALTPELSDRLEAGGVVGKIILGLLAIGLIIALVRGASLIVTRQKIQAQLKNPQQPQDNPLGRVLAVYQQGKEHTVEALELRLLETIVDEQTSLERGLSMLKLLAALAPMLGLLGTVTGMIETFQVITQFGNGDPKVMAGGISMALVTTVLGLIAAMPLLLAHNVLSSQAETIRNILEKQGIGLVAAQAENDCVVKPAVERAA